MENRTEMLADQMLEQFNWQVHTKIISFLPLFFGKETILTFLTLTKDMMTQSLFLKLKIDVNHAKVLVKISTNCSLVFMYLIEISSSYIVSRIKWHSILICFIRSWNIGLNTIWRVVWISHHNFVGMKVLIPISIGS